MLIAARNAMMAGKRLPYDAEVEYIESTGTQWIDTGVSPYGRTPIARVDFALQNQVGIIGVFGTWASNNRRVQIFVGPNYNGSLGIGTYKNYTFSRYTKYDVTLNGDTKTALVNGSTISGFNTDNGFGDYNLYLFWRNNNNGDGTKPAIMLCYACQIWDGSTLVRDFIPVRVGSVGYMYDRVTGRLFGNAGTGDFVLGPDVVPVEYIESHGTEWIDTGYVYNADSKFVCDAMLMSVPSDTFATMFGAVQNYNGVFLALNNTVPIQARFGANSVGNIVSDLSVQNAVGVRHKYELSARWLAIDDDVFTRSGFTPYTVNRSIWLCSCNDSESGNLNKRPCSLRVYAFDINNGNTAVHKYLPVRVGTEGAMMDTLTRRIYRNAGTGAFTYGNDLKYPIPAE